jgi:hypothetical protein
MAEEGLICWSCGRPTGLVGGVGRQESCPECMADLRCCRGCRHFDPTHRHQCREPIDTNISNKGKANFCDWFQVRQMVKGPGGLQNPTDAKDERKKRFDDLFND